MHKADTLLWLNDARGVYISDEDWATLEQGPDAEGYWDAWTDVLDNAVVTDDNGVKFTLHQDGDLWLIPEGMEWSEENDCFQWPETEEEET